jgi:hypothetical protein
MTSTHFFLLAKVQWISRLIKNTIYLLSLLKQHLPTVCSSYSESLTILSFLQPIIKYNTFFANNTFYLQNVGLPMGGCLSGSLANIYLGFLEETFISKYTSSLLLYTRYMDDILIILDTDSLPLHEFLTQLKDTFQLSITSSSSPSHVTFLDTRINFNSISFELNFFSKTLTPFRLPLAADKRPSRYQVSLFQSQLLRMWRLSTCNNTFSMQIQSLLAHLPSTGLEDLLKPATFMFLNRVRISKSLWSTSHLLCQQCLKFCSDNRIIIRKVIINANRPIASRIPISCETPNIHFILLSPPTTHCILTQQNTLHNLLFHQAANNILPHTQIFPFTNMKECWQ